MCSYSMASAHVILEVNQTKIKDGCQSVRKVLPHNSKSDLPLGTYVVHSEVVYIHLRLREL